MSNTEGEDGPTAPTIESSDFLLKHNSGIDLGDRYENILQRQFDSLSNLEDKAWKTIGAITSIIGIILTGFSILTNLSNAPESVPAIDVVPLVIGLSSLFSSIVYCIFVLVSTEARYGPSTSLADEITDGEIDREYVDFMLMNYTTSISQNWGKISTKSSHLRKAFCYLPTGLLFSTLSFLFLILSWGECPLLAKIIALVIVASASIILSYYIWNRKFLSSNTPADEGETESTEDTEGTA